MLEAGSMGAESGAGSLLEQSSSSLLKELERRGVFADLDGAVGALYDHLERVGALDSESGLIEYLAKRLRLQAAKLAELRGFAGAAEPWAASMAAMDADRGEDAAQSSKSVSPRTVEIGWSIGDTDQLGESSDLVDEPEGLVERVRQILWSEIGHPYGGLYEACARAGNEYIDDAFHVASARLLATARTELLAERKVRVAEDVDQPGLYVWISEAQQHPDGCDVSFHTAAEALADAWERFKDEFWPADEEGDGRPRLSQRGQ